MTTHKNAELYRELDVQFPSDDAANEALAAFYAEVRAAREKHRIADVLMVCRVRVPSEGGAVGAMSSSHFGSSEHALPLAAYIFGRERKIHEMMVQERIADGEKGVK